MRFSLSHLVIIAGSFGLTALPALGQLSALPPLNFCDASLPPPCPQYFVPRDGIPVPGLEIVPWNDPRAVIFLNEFNETVPPNSQLGQLIGELGSDAINQAIQSNVNDPALVSSFGQLLLVSSSENPDPAALRQAEADFIAWLQANVSSEDDSLLVLDESLVPGFENVVRAAAEVLGTLSSEEQAALSSSPELLRAFITSLPPQSALAQVSLSQQGQETIYRYLLDRTQLIRRTRQNPMRVGSANSPLDLSGLNLSALPTSDAMYPAWVAQAPVNGAVTDALQSEVEAYQIAYAATDLFKAGDANRASEMDPVVQGLDADLVAVNRPWSAFISGDIAWGNTQSSTRFDLNNYVIMAGADYTFNPNFLLGGAIAYSTGSQRSNLSTAEANSVSLSLYGTGQYGTGGYTTGFVGYGFDNFDSRRTIFIPGFNREATGSTSGNQFNVGVETGWVFSEGGFFLQPSLGLRHTSNRVNGYTETGAGTLSTVVDNYNTNSTIANLGFDVAYPIATGDRYILPFVGLGLNHRLGYSAPVVTARFVGGTTSFVVPVADVDRTWFDLSAGVSAELSRHTVGQVIFRTDFGRFDSNVSNFSINLRHDF